MAWKTLSVERDGPIAHVWLERPERRNALNSLVLEELRDAFESLETDFDARVVVLGGRGKSFSSGADLKDPPSSRPEPRTDRERRWISQQGLRAVRAIENLEAVTIARVHGHAIGGGAVLPLACDLRIAAEGTIFQIPEVDLGVPLGWGATPRLIREVGPARARELILLCDRFDAAQALEWGLLNRVVPYEELDATVNDWAVRLAAKPEIAVHMTKTQFRAYAASAPLGDTTEGDGDLLTAAMRGPNARRSFGRD